MPTTFVLAVRFGNAAFEDDPGELARILRRLATQIDDSPPRTLDAGALLDTNGNTVGSWDLDVADDEDETTPALHCDWGTDCGAEVTHIDNRGFIYCTPHGIARRDWRPCRQLRPHELARLRRGDTIKRY